MGGDEKQEWSCCLIKDRLSSQVLPFQALSPNLIPFHPFPSLSPSFIYQEARLSALAAQTSRPDWMLAPPKQVTLSSQVGDPLSLKSRGFSQNTRVQTKSGAGVPSEMDQSLWTETPDQREERLRDEMMGKRKRATDGEGGGEMDVEEIRERERERRIREEIREKVSFRREQENQDVGLIDLVFPFFAFLSNETGSF